MSIILYSEAFGSIMKEISTKENENNNILSKELNVNSLNWIDVINETSLKAESIINDMLNMISEFHESESQKDEINTFNFDAVALNASNEDEINLDSFLTSNNRRKQILGDVLDYEIVTTRVDVQIKSDKTKYCLLRVLKAHFLFSQLSEHEMEDLIDSMQSYVAIEGDIVIRQGQPGESFFILESGRCQSPLF